MTRRNQAALHKALTAVTLPGYVVAPVADQLHGLPKLLQPPPGVGTSVYSNQHCDSGTAVTTIITRELGQELQEQRVGAPRNCLHPLRAPSALERYLSKCAERQSARPSRSLAGA
jgi:hypothetical protein